jgi:alpha-aminoadipate carrier protein LysW
MPLDVEEDELDEGDILSCDECGATLAVADLEPLELEVVDDEEDDDLDDEDDEEEEEDWK